MDVAAARPGRVLAAALLLLAALLSWPNRASAEPGRQILLIFDEDKDLPGMSAINRGLRAQLQAEFPDDITFYSESLHLSQFGSDEYLELTREFLADKYSDLQLDLVVAVMEPSLDFVLRHRDTMFAGLPVVFCGVDSFDLENLTLPEGVTGVMMKRSYAPTLDLALKLQPDTRNVFVIGGTSRFDQRTQAIARRDLQRFEPRLKVTWLTSLPMPDLLQRVKSLPRNSVIYYLSLFTDGAGQPFVTHDALKRITNVANAPVYVAVDQYVGAGALGGSVYNVRSLGDETARVVARILRGDAASGIPPIALSANVPMFDWRQLQRWRLDERLLPEGSALQHRIPSVWESHRWFIIVGVSLFLLQSALLIGLLVNRAERLRAEQASRESEERRRRAEEAVQRQRDELAHALRLTTLGELTASISHELNQPLTAIAANAQAAQKLGRTDRANPDFEEALEDMVTDSIRAAEIIRRLQALFRKRPAVQAALDVNALIDDVLRLLDSDLRNRQIRVQFVREGELPKVLGDGVQLRQVLINLLRNAEDAIALAGEEPREIHISTRRPGDSLIAIDIRDSGVGAEESDLERIFEHFISSKAEGLGMGLAISRSIIEACGGRIWATRNTGRGLTLHIELPALREPQAQSTKVPRTGAARA